jgi:chromosome segregation ATPase
MSTETRLDRLEAALTRLAEAQAKTEERVTRLEEALIRLTERVDALAMRMDQLTERVDRLAQRMDQLVGGVTNMRGDLLELRYRQHAVAYFAPLLRGIREVPPSEVDRLAEDAERAGRLTEAEHLDLVRADLVLTGSDRRRLMPAYLVIEVSALIDSQDVERAARRAQLMEKAGLSTLAAVAGEGITHDAEAAAHARAVRIVLDGSVVS